MSFRTLCKQLDLAHRWWLAGMFLYAVAHLIVLRGVHPGVLLVFLAPPLLAIRVAGSFRSTTGSKRVAKSFLVSVGLAIVVGLDTDILPRMKGNAGMPDVAGRILTLYAGVYVFFFLGVMPPFLFGRSLWQHRRGEAAQYSRPTCYLGLLTWALMSLAMLIAVPKLVRRWM